MEPNERIEADEVEGIVAEIEETEFGESKKTDPVELTAPIESEKSATKTSDWNQTESYFYVLWCRDNTFYAGYTTDLKRRELEHNEGTGAKYTRPKNRRPLKMIYAETFETKSDAMKAEAAFKRLMRPQKEAYLRQNDVKFPLSKKRDCVIKERGTFYENTKEF